MTASPWAPSTPVVIMGGLGAPRVAAEAYASVFRMQGFTVRTVPQRVLNYGDIRQAAERLARQVERVREETSAPEVHLVGMSLGGLIGLYYVKCLGGAAAVERFISVGGPLNGSKLAHASALPALGRVHSFRQTRPDSALIREIQAAPVPSGVRMYSVGTRGDFITPRESWDAEGLEPIETPYGTAPVGHWMLFAHPGNHRVVAQLLRAP